MDAGISTAPDHPDLSVSYLKGKPKDRFFYWIYPLSTLTRYRVHNSNITSCVRAMKERLLFVKKGGVFIPTPRPTISFTVACKTFVSAFSKLVHPVSPLTDDQFLGAYKGRRRTVYEDAMNSLVCKPFRLADSYVNFFVKCEKINFSAKPDAVPRGISPRNPRYHVKLGPYIKRIEKKIYDNIAKVFGAKTVFKGLNAADRGHHLRDHWESFDDPVAVGLDASRFDQHVSVQALKYEHAIYKQFYPGDRVFSSLLRMQCNNRIFANCPDGRAELNLVGARMSGDMNTALGNCLIMSSLVYSYLITRVTKFRLANDGDDCVVIIEKKELQKIADLSSYFLKLGFDMKIEDPVYIFEQIEFCQSQPVWTPEGWIMVRKVAASIAKDSISIKPLDNPKVFRRWMKAVGEGGLALTGGIPIMQDIYWIYFKTGGDAKALEDPTMETGAKQLAAGMKRKYSRIHPLTRVSFWRAFGITVAAQQCLESHIRKLSVEFEVCDEMLTRPEVVI